MAEPLVVVVVVVVVVVLVVVVDVVDDNPTAAAAAAFVAEEKNMVLELQAEGVDSGVKPQRERLALRTPVNGWASENAEPAETWPHSPRKDATSLPGES